jgi:cytochrome c-type biogenesis protein CcmH
MQMVFWILAVVITLLAAAPLAWTLFHRGRRSSGQGNDIQVYTDQLSEIDRDLARGVISEGEAERVRVEVSRRLLEADRAARDAGPATRASSSPLLAALLVPLVFGGAYFVYITLGAPSYPDLPITTRLANSEEFRQNRPSQAEYESQLDLPPRKETGSARQIDLVEKLRQALLTRTDDLKGQQLLASNEAQLGNYAAAYKAQKRVIDIKGNDASAADYAAYVDMLVQAAGGYVSPEAEAAIQHTLEMEPMNGPARYYKGLMQAQIGRADLAFEIWQKLMTESIPAAPWMPPIRAQIELAAREAGIKYTLPAETAGPTAEQVQSAQDMTPEQQADLIRTMVGRLSARLADQGGSPQEWAQLIGALGVLNDTARAKTIWDEARTVFADNQTALTTIDAAAKRAGLRR